ncbi:alcohol dehydrogenase catalytic domain-containing protein [Streptomyces gossypiisoli]
MNGRGRSTASTAVVCPSHSYRAARGSRPRPVWWRPPFLLSHEAAGTIEAVGEGVTDLRPGDCVVLAWWAPCGSCRSCRRAGWDARQPMPTRSSQWWEAGISYDTEPGLTGRI